MQVFLQRHVRHATTVVRSTSDGSTLYVPHTRGLLGCVASKWSHARMAHPLEPRLLALDHGTRGIFLVRTANGRRAVSKHATVGRGARGGAHEATDASTFGRSTVFARTSARSPPIPITSRSPTTLRAH